MNTCSVAVWQNRAEGKQYRFELKANLASKHGFQEERASELGSLGGGRLGSAYSREKASRALMCSAVLGGALSHRLPTCRTRRLQWRVR